MSRTPLEVIREGYAEYDSGDFPRVFDLLSPEIEIYQTPLLPWGGDYKGQDGLRAFFTNLHAHTATKPKPLIYIPAGDDVAVIGRLVGVAHATKKPIDCDFVHVWTVRDGLITRFRSYVDTPALLAALAPNE